VWVWVRVRAGRSGFWRVDKAWEIGKRGGWRMELNMDREWGWVLGLGGFRDEGARIRWHTMAHAVQLMIVWQDRLGGCGCYRISDM